ncbi:MAG TPA: Txe/YoeB family addiction module toxin [Prolixibacteraceae bacterium]|mgnify:FL=1|nr:Txe/YoeB family addiction module toxin [Prolixibacteraceae bacterium]
MEVVYKEKALKDLLYWKKSGDLNAQHKISKLVYDIQLHPKTGLGRPEELKYELSGLWSRKIDKKNRLIYEIHKDCIHILSMLGHYSDK